MVWMVSLGLALSTRSLNVSSGATAKGTASTPSTVKRRSGMRSLLQLREEVAYLSPNFGAAGQPVPVGANQPHQLVALVDGCQIIFGGAIQPVHQQRLDVRFHLTQNRILMRDVRPGIERQERLGAARRARIHGQNPAFRAALQEEGEANRYQQAVP